MTDLEYIKNKIEEDDIRAPESLSGRNMYEKLKAADEMEEAFAPPKHIPWYKSRTGYIAALAACLVLTLIAAPSAKKIINSPNEAQVALEKEADIETFKSEGEINKKIRSISDADSFGWFFNGSRKYEETLVEDAELSATGDMAVSENAASAKSHSETYKQVEGVDEADIIKTDGKFIYLVNGYNDVEIFKAEDGKAELKSTISKFKEDERIENIYLNGSELVTVGSFYEENREKTVVRSYDVSDHADPKEKGCFFQSGSLLTSRMTGNVVYIVTNEYAGEDHCIPFITAGSDYKAMKAENVSCMPNPSQASFVTVSSIKFNDGKKIKSQTRAVLGASGDIYCNTENLYLTGTDRSGNNTNILKVALNDGDLKFKSEGKVRGTVYGQFAMDEKDGLFRIATTSSRNGHDENNLFVLDEKLEEMGSVKGFARNEHIEAVRFIGEKAYIITYEQIDPLFILDLSDPKEPKIDGEVKITGFSTLLTPVGDNKLIGIGYGTKDNGYGGEMSNGLKIALFDISNPSKPKVLDSKEYEDMNSEAQYDHHALLENKEAGYLALPYSSYEDQWTDDVIIEDAEVMGDESADVFIPEPEVKGGVLVFTADDKINIKEDHKMTEGARRCIYIGDYIYAVSESDEITGFKP